MSPHFVAPLRIDVRSLLGGAVLVAITAGGLSWTSRVSRATTASRTEADRLRENAALMVAGIDADRKSIELAAQRGDTIALRDAEASIRRRTQRLAANIAALDSAGEASSPGRAVATTTGAAVSDTPLMAQRP